MIEKSISEIVSKNPETNLKLDLNNLKDISSAGIRLLMDLKNLY
jgi:anti-anti-sigma regulatory factor